jgi:tetratricopeptide (TPR) repeat protein
MKKYALLFSLFVLCCFAIKAQNPQLDARKLSRQGLFYLDSGDWVQAMRLFKQAQQLDTANINYQYQIASVVFLNKDFKQTVKILLPLLSHRDVSPNMIRLLANSYDNLGQQDKAIEYYKKGIELSPHDGKFYHDLGNIYLMRKQIDIAEAYFERGLEMDNKFVSNYYWAAKTALSRNDTWWGLLYGEIFLNIERNSQRTYEISRLLYENYSKMTKPNSDSSMIVETSNLPWKGRFDKTCDSILRNITIKVQKSKIAATYELRKEFLRELEDTHIGRSTGYILFDFLREVDQHDHLEAYHYWLLNQGNEIEFEDWTAKNAPAFGRFITWFVQHPLELSGKKMARREME